MLWRKTKVVLLVFQNNPTSREKTARGGRDVASLLQTTAEFAPNLNKIKFISKIINLFKI